MRDNGAIGCAAITFCLVFWVVLVVGLLVLGG